MGRPSDPTPLDLAAGQQTTGRVADVCPLPPDSCWRSDPKLSINRRKGYKYRHKHCDLASLGGSLDKLKLWGSYSCSLTIIYIICVIRTKYMKRTDKDGHAYGSFNISNPKLSEFNFVQGIITVLLFHTQLSPLHEFCNSSDQAAHYHILAH